MYAIVAVVVGISVLLVSVVAVGNSDVIVVASCDVRLYDDSSSNPSVCVGFL